MNVHNMFMDRCLQLAQNGLGTTYPNPLVGAIIVTNGKIIGEGWHQKAGEPHAEVHAIDAVKDKSLLKDATIYVNLEPCSHFGRTPPCADLIIKHQIKKVVIGTEDPFSKVAGNGIKKLKNSGCQVIVNVREKQCLELNKRFFTFFNKLRPYIILKWAETIDGYIAPTRQKSKQPFWISNPYSRQLVHRWRSQEQAILAGTTTILKDDPEFTVRDWHGKHPFRVTIDRKSKIPGTFKIYNAKADTLVFSEKEILEKPTVTTRIINSSQPVVEQISKVLFEKQLQSVIVEGGTKTLQLFIQSNLWDEARVFEGTEALNSGIKAPTLKNGKITSKTKILNDTLTVYQND